MSRLGDYFVMAKMLKDHDDLTLVKGPGMKQTMSYDEAWQLACETADSFRVKTFVCGFVNFTTPKA